MWPEGRGLSCPLGKAETEADPAKAGPKLAESAAQVILHGTTATDHVPLPEIEAIRAVTAAPIILVTSASANSTGVTTAAGSSRCAKST